MRVGKTSILEKLLGVSCNLTFATNSLLSYLKIDLHKKGGTKCPIRFSTRSTSQTFACDISLATTNSALTDTKHTRFLTAITEPDEVGGAIYRAQYLALDHSACREEVLRATDDTLFMWYKNFSERGEGYSRTTVHVELSGPGFRNACYVDLPGEPESLLCLYHLR